MKKLLILALITILLTLAGCTKNNTSSGGVSSADNIADNSFVEENISSEIETENSEDTDISEPKETASEENKTNETNSTVSNESVVENNSSTTTTTKKEEVNSTTNNTNSSENNDTTSNTSSETSKPEIKTLIVNELTTYYGFTGFFYNPADGCDYDPIALKLGMDTSTSEDGILLSNRVSEFKDNETGAWLIFVFRGTADDSHNFYYDYILPACSNGPTLVNIIRAN